MKVLRKMDWNELKHEYQLDGKRLLPWQGWDMPFGGAWCVVRPNTDSLRHAHEEQEMFIVASGRAKIRLDDEFIEVTKGDFIAIPPDKEHYVINETDEDFHFFTMWWDRETVTEFLEKLNQKDVVETNG